MKSGSTHFRGLGRELAMQFLFQYDLTKEDFEEGMLIRFFKQSNLSGKFENSKKTEKSKKYAEKLVLGIITNLPEIDTVIKKFITDKWSWERIALVDREILRVATYEMMFTENVPPIVTINEAVELAKNFSSEESKGFVNALLNNIKNNLDRDPRVAK